MAFTQKVAPDNGVAEGRYVALAIVAILGIGTLLLPHHQAGSHHAMLAAHQIAHNELPAGIQVPFTDLKLAHEEIRDWHQDNLDDGLIGIASWPGIAELSDSYIPPFSEGRWQQPGEGLYLGQLQEHLLLLDSTLPDAQLWLCDAIPAHTDAETLKHTGCQQVVAPGAQNHKDH
ncbi:hypothetical protein KUV89_01790 [Marinobacter hydrocarbonoclasticus]|nr:hypothetical protein [Marinobacter nauticus]